MRGSTANGPGRWLLLAAYGLTAASTQMLWVSFAPITTESARALHASVGAVGDLAAIFPLVYVVCALPAGRWLDRGFARALRVGALLTGLPGLLRLVAPTSYAWQLAMEVLIALGQPLVLNAITKLAGRHFARRERPTAIAIGSVALFLGIMLAMAFGPWLFALGGLRLVLLAQGLFAAAGALWLVLGLGTPAAYPDEGEPEAASWLPREPLLWRLGLLLFVGMGVYNVLATWLEPILAPFGRGGLAGDLLAVMTLAGIVGAALLPPLAAKRGMRRGLLFLAVAFTLLCALALDARQEALWLFVWLGLEGFFLLASLPVVLDWAEVTVGPGRQGSAVGFLMLAGNLGGFVLVFALTPLVAMPHVALLAIALVSLAGVGAALGLPARGGKGEAVASEPG